MKNPVKAVFSFGIRLLGREVFFYLFFGVLTTLINIAAYYLLRLAGGSVAVSTTIGFAASVLFAYVTNRKWVFESKAAGAREVLMEMWKFFSVRIGTYVFDLLLMLLLVDVLKFSDLLCKIAVNVLVVVLNYIASKCIVFRRKK